MEARNPQFFYPPPQSYPSAMQTENPLNHLYSESQVQRWANWVKFIACFIIINSTINLLKLVFQFIFNDRTNPVSDDGLIQLIFLELLYIGVGYLGYSVSNKKTSVSAKNYVAILILMILVGSVIMASAFYQIILQGCHQEADQDEEKTCDKDVILSIALLIGGIFCVVTSCMCLPYILCTWKLRRFAEELEGSRRLTPVHNIQMMNYTSNDPINFEQSRN